MQAVGVSPPEQYRCILPKAENIFNCLFFLFNFTQQKEDKKDTGIDNKQHSNCKDLQMQHNVKLLRISPTEIQNKLDLPGIKAGKLEMEEAMGCDNKTVMRNPALSWQDSCHKSEKTILTYDFDEHI